MADFSSISSPTHKFKKPTSFPRLFTGFNLKPFTETESSVMSPTSILDTKPFSVFKNPFRSESNSITYRFSQDTETRHKLNTQKIGLGIVDALAADDNSDADSSKPETRMVLFGSQLKIQIPTSDFGVKTRYSPKKNPVFSLSDSSTNHMGFDNPGLAKYPVVFSGSDSSESSPWVFSGCLSASEMEMSEDYTCVISHGPNPKTVHIFDNCIVDSCCGDGSGRLKGFGSSYPSKNFLSFCYGCKKSLGYGKDIFMYKGEKAFCSQECRIEEMMVDEDEE